MSMPNYDMIGHSIFLRNNSAVGIAAALKAAYNLGLNDSLSPEELAAVVRLRVQKHVGRVNNLADRIGSLTQELRNEFPRKE